jgi:hypothetical protein
MPAEANEVGVGCQNRQAAPFRGRANQKVGSGRAFALQFDWKRLNAGAMAHAERRGL